MDAVYAHMSDRDIAWVQTLTNGEIAQVLSHCAELMRLVGPPPEELQLRPPASTRADPERAVSHPGADDPRPVLPVLAGIAGEDLFEKAVAALSSSYVVKNMAKQGKKGDFIIEWDEMGSHRALIDIKNYSSSVPTKEVEKLKRDIECNQSITAGMMISLKSKITGYSSFAIEHAVIGRKKVPLVFISTKNPQLIVEYVRFMFYMAASQKRGIDMDDAEITKKYIMDISTQMDVVSQLSNSFAQMKQEMNRGLDRAILDMTICENRIRSSLDHIVRVVDEKCRNMQDDADEPTMEDVLGGIAKMSPKNDLEVFQKMWMGKWDSRTIKNSVLTMEREGKSISLKFMKTKINATINTGGTTVAMKLDTSAIPVLCALGVAT